MLFNKQTLSLAKLQRLSDKMAAAATISTPEKASNRTINAFKVCHIHPFASIERLSLLHSSHHLTSISTESLPSAQVPSLKWPAITSKMLNTKIRGISVSKTVSKVRLAI